MQKQRLFKWDNLKGLLILLVVIGHFTEPFLDLSHFFKSLWLFIYSFHMPMFFVAAGYFHRNQNIRRKVLYYLALYLLTNILIFLCSNLIGQSSKLNLLSNSGLPWFMLVMSYYVVVTWLLRDLNPCFSLFMAFVAGLFSGCDAQVGDMLALSRAIVFYPFYLYGNYLAKHSSLLQRKNIPHVVGILILLIWFVLCFYKTDIFYLLRPLFTGRNSFSAVGLGIEGVLVRLLCYTITTVVGVGLLLLAPEKKLPLFTRCGKRSLQIYVLHIPLRNAAVKFLPLEAILSSPAPAHAREMLYLLAVMALVFLLSCDLFEVPLRYLKRKMLQEEWSQDSMK